VNALGQAIVMVSMLTVGVANGADVICTLSLVPHPPRWTLERSCPPWSGAQDQDGGAVGFERATHRSSRVPVELQTKGRSRKMDIATALTRAGVSSCWSLAMRDMRRLWPGSTVQSCSHRTSVIDAHTPADVSIAIEVVADRGETLTVMGAGHGRLHGVRDGVAITLRHLDAVGRHRDRPHRSGGAGSTWEPVLAATVHTVSPLPAARRQV